MAKVRSEAGDKDLVRLYLDEIGRYPLLTHEDEMALARDIEAGREAEVELDSSPSLPPARRRELLRVTRRADEARDLFVKSNLRLVVSIAKRFQSADVALLDLIQEGNLGLIHAVEKFDWRRGFKFSTYATWWIRQSIGRGIDNTSRIIRLPVHVGDTARKLNRARTLLEAELGPTPTSKELGQALGLTSRQVEELLVQTSEPVSLDSPIGEDGDTDLGEVVPDSNAASPFEVVARSMMSQEVDKLLSLLDDRERRILQLRYGLDRGDPRTLEEVGSALRLTRERIRQIERNALTKLRRPSPDPAVRDLMAS
jgi:RNA polymerase sigma factor (sigma-70 family)